ncbi:MAG: peptidylprolyl isomerase, partial [Anaerolineales bacterium]|nr:peptidylprolyl isomerase [Anaerolineales bacterium]
MLQTQIHSPIWRNGLLFVQRLFILIAAVLIGACSQPTVTPEPTQHPTETRTPNLPTATPVPLAAKVNGEEITLAEFQAELERYQMAFGTELATKAQQVVIDELVDKALLAQAAHEAGYKVDEKMVNDRIQQLITQVGGEAILAEWMAKYGYTMESFRLALGRDLAAIWMRNQILAQTPREVEQVHARQILLYSAERAQAVYAELQSGKDFGVLAEQFDPITYGDLGWLARGMVLDPQLEEVIFSLQPGQYSEVVHTLAGYHIVQVLERDPKRHLTTNAYRIYQKLTLQEWLAKRRASSQIEIF